MLKKYTLSPSVDVKNAPNTATLNAILNYSKSLNVAKMKKAKVLIHLN